MISANQSQVILKATQHNSHMYLALLAFEGWDGLGHSWLDSNECWSTSIGSRCILEQQTGWEQCQLEIGTNLTAQEHHIQHVRDSCRMVKLLGLEAEV